MLQSYTSPFKECIFHHADKLCPFQCADEVFTKLRFQHTQSRTSAGGLFEMLYMPEHINSGCVDTIRTINIQNRRRIGAWTDIPYRSGHAPTRPAHQAPQNRTVATRRGYNEHIGRESIGPTSKFVNSIKSLFLTESY